MQYQCNICGTDNDGSRETGREVPDCLGCGSSLRMRAMIGLLSLELFGRVLPIADFPVRKDIRGVGLSDWDGYAKRLSTRLDYTNTYYHQSPYLDITSIGKDICGTCDFLISSDVFEHVAPPVEAAFVGARRLLKPGGVLVMTVPYMVEVRETKEHFPELHDWSLVKPPWWRSFLRGEKSRSDAWKLCNRRRDGAVEWHENLIFHGGPGTTLEMRVFSEMALLSQLAEAGFSKIYIAKDALPEAGVQWPVPWSLPVVARA